MTGQYKIAKQRICKICGKVFYTKFPNQKYCRKIKEAKKEIIKLLGGKCVCCGITDIRVLQIDHVNNDGLIERKLSKKHRRNVYSIIFNKIKERSKDYQLLCLNCHHLKTNYIIPTLGE